MHFSWLVARYSWLVYPLPSTHGAGFHFDPSGSRLKCMLVV
jgi:hypothetical protein